jgi:hypothetical protein
MKSWEWDQIDSQFSQVRVQLTWESEAASDSGHGCGNEMVKISVGWGGKFQGSEADIVKSLVINAHAFIGIFDQLMDGQGSVVWFNDGVRYFW